MAFLVVAIFLLFQASKVMSLTPGSIREMSGLYFAEERSGLHDQYTGRFEPGLSPNVSKLCLSALQELSTNTSQISVLGQYIDAMGKPGSGISEGNVVWYGSYSSCQNIPDAHYCLAAVSVIVSHKAIPVLWGLCVPNECTERDITVGLHDTFAEIFKLLRRPFTEGKVQIIINTDPSAQPVNCARPSKWTTGPIITLVVCAIVALLCITGTLLEMFVVDESWKFWVQPIFRTSQPSSNGVLAVSRNSDLLQSDSEGAPLLNSFPQLHDSNATTSTASIQIQQPRYKGRGFLVNFLLCFSIIRNTNKIMDTSVPSAAITSLNGVRVLSMWWVILGHTFLWLLIFRVYNDVLLGINIIHRFSFQSVNNAFFSVDSFFVLSGVLVAYLSFRRMEKNNGRLPLFKFYFHRFWRLTPSYMFVILFYANLMGFLGEGPLWFGSQRRTTCDQYWWTNLLYINNFYPKELARECLGWSWYLANDMQFYIISPLLIFIIYRFAWIGLAAAIGGLLWASFIVTGTIIGVYKTNVLEANDIESLFEGKTNQGDYTDLVYIKPYCRITPYLVGIVLGYIIYREKSSTKKSFLSEVPKQIVSVIGWCLAIIFGLSSVFGVYSSLRQGGKPFSLAENVIYGTFSRFVWGVSLAWVIYACHKGYGSLVDKILSARFWIPLSRLTYSAYLLHPIVLTSYFGSFRDTVQYTDMSLAFYFVSVVVMSYAAAFILAACVEFPMMQLESVLFFKA